MLRSIYDMPRDIGVHALACEEFEHASAQFDLLLLV